MESIPVYTVLKYGPQARVLNRLFEALDMSKLVGDYDLTVRNLWELDNWAFTSFTINGDQMQICKGCQSVS